MAEDTEVGSGEDLSWWDCSLCTYKNSADKFKCEICDLRRGTSTRKPRNNADTIVAQVVKQQEQIRQQTKAKPSPKSRASLGGIPPPAGENYSLTAIAASSNDPAQKINSKKRVPAHGLILDSEPSSDSEVSIYPSKSKKKKLKFKKSRPIGRKSSTTNSHHNNNNIKSNEFIDDDETDSIESDDDNRNNDDDDSSDATDELSRASTPQTNGSESGSNLERTNGSRQNSPSEATTSSPNHHHTHPAATIETNENPFKITPLEISGNLIKYSPPTSSGRTGLIIDKKRFTQHSVTVNDVTITFTEFATRQNKYIRKKKKRREDTRQR